MQRFHNILLLASNTMEMDETFDRAVELAENNQAQLTVVDVLKELPPKKDPAKTSVPLSKSGEMTPEDRLERLIAYVLHSQL